MEENTICGMVEKQWELAGEISRLSPYGNGHINGTWLVETKEPARRYILQRINRSVFAHPEEVMENILRVTTHLREKIAAAGGDPGRETLHVILTREGRPCFADEAGETYRLYDYVEDTVCLEGTNSARDFEESGRAFGRFQAMLADFPAETLHETIPHFHDTMRRFETFQETVRRDPAGRVKFAEAEIDFTLRRRELAGELSALQAAGALPLRVTHNDTKLNNVLFDRRTGRGLCVIDLDTVMPGLAVNDFGDSIRFGASTAAEDERDLEKVSCDMKLFEAYTDGFISGCGGRLTRGEIQALPLAARTMTFECGMRFLTDHLEGDTYFKISREQHNLERCRTQYRLLTDMEKKQKEMQQIVCSR